MTQPVEVRREPPLRWVKLDASPRNVLDVEAIAALREALAYDPETPVVVLRGRTDGFCAGLDGKILARGGLEREELLAAMGELLLATLEGSTRIVAVCEGHAVAAGAMILLVADLRLGTPGSYRIGFTEPGLGMPLPAVPALLARERLDRRRLHELTVLGRTVGPEGAAEAGFLDAVVDPITIEDVAAKRAREIAQLSEVAYAGTLTAVRGPAIERIREMVRAQSARRDAARR